MEKKSMFIWRRTSEIDCELFCKPAAQIEPRQIRFEVYRSHEITNADGRAPLKAWSARRRSRYLHKTQQTQETNIHALSEIRIRDPRNHATEIGVKYSVILYIISNYVTAEFLTYYTAYRRVWNRINGLLSSLSNTVNRSTELIYCLTLWNRRIELL
jgi:hypothetical protein